MGPKKIVKSRKQMTGGKKRRLKQSFFKRDAAWMTWLNFAPFGIGVVLALIFWFTR